MYGEERISKITVRFTEQEKEQLKDLAEKNGIKVSQFIRDAINSYINKEEK